MTATGSRYGIVSLTVGGLVMRSVLTLLFAISACCSSLSSADDEAVADWLMRVEMAPDRVDYAGSFLYEHDGQMDTMRIVHVVSNGMFRERLYSLTGSAREVIRDEKSVWCFLPDKKIGVHEYRQSSRNAFLQIRGDQIATLGNNYSFELKGNDRVADRSAQKIVVMPKDEYRYGYELWVDKQTGLLLRSDLMNQNGDTIERYMFVEVQIGAEINLEELEPKTTRQSLSWFGIDQPVSSDIPDPKMDWDSSSLPAGFKLSYSISRRDPMEDHLVEHHVYSDGLSSVSLFVKENQAESAGNSGISRMGAVSAYATHLDGFLVTVLGEVPETTVSMIAKGVVHSN